MRTFSTTPATLLAFAALMIAGSTPTAFGAQDVEDTGAIEIPAGHKATTAASTLSLSTSVSIGIAPTQVTLVATVSGTALKGDIAFKSGTAMLAAATITKNTATVTVTLPAAIHSLTAVYTTSAGDIVSPPAVVVVDNNALACS